jgi:hypothetical protein
MNAKLKLNLAAAGAGIALIGQGWTMSEAIAGPNLSTTSNLTYNAGANFNLQQAQTFSATGNYSGTVSPFAVTATLTTNTTAGTIAGAAGNLSAGVSTLTAAFDRDGFQDNTDNNSFAVQAGVIGLGGNAPTAGVTTGPVGSDGLPATTGIITAGVATNIVFNQNATTGLPSISITGASSNTGIVGASITSQLIGASVVSGTFSDNLSVVNSLSAFD